MAVTRRSDRLTVDADSAVRVRLDQWLWAARFFKTRGLAQDAIEDLTGHGLDALTVELVLDMLYAARDLDEPDEP